jgi:hypothetical protein
VSLYLASDTNINAFVLYPLPINKNLFTVECLYLYLWLLNSNVDFKNCCNEDDYASLYFVDGSPCGGYFLTITPNPANGETTVSIEPSAGAESFDENTEWDLEIYGASQNLQEKKPKQKTAPQNCKPPGGKRVFTLFARCLMMKY